MADTIKHLFKLINQSSYTVALTGAGISTPSEINDLEHMTGEASSIISSESSLLNDPEGFYNSLKETFLDPIFKNGPTASHKVLAKLEDHQLLDGIVTTNVDYLHELSGSKNVADVWGSFNQNICVKCGKIYPIDIWDQGSAPFCPDDNGIISPYPTFHHIARSPEDLTLADTMMKKADLVIVIGSNGYYSNINSTAKVVQINPKRTGFDLRADLNIHSASDKVFNQLEKLI